LSTGRRDSPTAVALETPSGTARAHLFPAAPQAAGLLVLGHGAGGGVAAADLGAARDAALSLGVGVALVEQPYRVAGRRSPAPAHQLDAAWVAVVAALRPDAEPLFTGGRSAGARVACRTAAALDADGVVCLAFPLHPPGKADDASKSRLSELEAVDAPVLVVQGERDPFGMPPPGPRREVVVVAGDHSLRAAGPVREAVRAWLEQLLRASSGAAAGGGVGS
jgi:predicted alpha/beta-hydrolase family hydrolase